jgi:MFS family permease
LIRRGPFLLLWAGGAVSSLGDHFSAIALMWLTYAASRSSFDVALVAVVSQVTYVVVGPVAGVLADRWDRRRTMIRADLTRAILLGGLALVTWRMGFSVPLALVVVFLLAVAGRVFGPARLAYMPTLVEPDDLMAANGLVSSTRQATGLGGQALAGFVISTVGALGGFIIDAVSFVLSALSLASIPTVSPPEAAPLTTEAGARPRRPFWWEIGEGWRVVSGIPVIRSLVVVAVFGNVVFAMIEPALPAYVRTNLHSGAWAYGLVGSFQFGGALLGGLLADRVARKVRAGLLFVVTPAIMGASIAATGVVQAIPLALGLWGAWAVVLSVMGVVEQSLEQALIPQQSMATVMALLSSVGTVLMPLGTLVGGVLANSIGAGPLYVLVGLGMAARAVVVGLQPTLRSATISAWPSDAEAR